MDSIFTSFSWRRHTLTFPLLCAKVFFVACHGFFRQAVQGKRAVLFLYAQYNDVPVRIGKRGITFPQAGRDAATSGLELYFRAFAFTHQDIQSFSYILHVSIDVMGVIIPSGLPEATRRFWRVCINPVGRCWYTIFCIRLFGQPKVGLSCFGWGGLYVAYLLSHI